MFEDKKRLITIAAIVVGVLVVGAGVLGYMVWQSAQQVSQSEEASKKAKDTPQYDNKQQVSEELNQKYSHGDFEGAIKLIEGQKTVEDPAMQLLLANAYVNSGNLQKALEIYKKLEAAGKLPGEEFANMAGIAERLNDNATAIAAYKKAVEYVQSTKNESQDFVAVYNYKIAELEKKR